MIADLHIQTKFSNGVTTLGKSYFTPPFKVANITEDKRSEWLQLMLMSSSPGVLDGDRYNLKIELSEGSSLHLHTQSYQRLFNMKEGATQQMEVYLQKGSSFIYLPHPSVPHENSIFKSTNKFYLADSCSLTWGEILTCGRKLSQGPSVNAEVFQFSSYRTITEIFIHDKLVIKEHLFMQPSLIDPNTIGQLEGYTHQASLIHLNGTTKGNSRQDIIYEYLSQQEEIISGVSVTGGNGLIVRILGYKAEQLYDHLQQITKLLQQKPTTPKTTTEPALSTVQL
jgi:urease accessory protein